MTTRMTRHHGAVSWPDGGRTYRLLDLKINIDDSLGAQRSAERRRATFGNAFGGTALKGKMI